MTLSTTARTAISTQCKPRHRSLLGLLCSAAVAAAAASNPDTPQKCLESGQAALEQKQMQAAFTESSVIAVCHS